MSQIKFIAVLLFVERVGLLFSGRYILCSAKTFEISVHNMDNVHQFMMET
jgi:hypothetical protein